jgi:hypothetical protein
MEIKKPAPRMILGAGLILTRSANYLAGVASIFAGAQLSSQGFLQQRRLRKILSRSFSLQGSHSFLPHLPLSQGSTLTLLHTVTGTHSVTL